MKLVERGELDVLARGAKVTFGEKQFAYPIKDEWNEIYFRIN
ncbi:hypothetical protein ACE2AK_18440 [Rahnella perminowiae]|nr:MULTISPECIES: hypothetical protein [Rahnella]MCR9003589.1 hypothetical protein [Rahnella perminowiae]